MRDNRYFEKKRVEQKNQACPFLSPFFKTCAEGLSTPHQSTTCWWMESCDYPFLELHGFTKQNKPCVRGFSDSDLLSFLFCAKQFLFKARPQFANLLARHFRQQRLTFGFIARRSLTPNSPFYLLYLLFLFFFKYVLLLSHESIAHKCSLVNGKSFLLFIFMSNLLNRVVRLPVSSPSKQLR